ncbi:MAG: glycosyltransferase [Phycisphaeraceae bacterium]|nr:glycosyltransferase [Phycisphaeraceae bacterium]
MRVLLVIHGYPPRYNAGSEVYTQTLARELASRHEVRVFTRQEDPFLTQFATSDETDAEDRRVRLRIVNNSESRDRYRYEGIDTELRRLLDEFPPDVVHVNHVSHLSTTLLRTIHDRGLPLVYTLHDFWLMCPRGQFIQRVAESGQEPFPLCDGQDDRKCAEKCYSLYFSGGPELHQADSDRWTAWVSDRMRNVRAMAHLVDAFIAPSRYLMARYRDEFGIPREKLIYLDYGFDLARLAGRQRHPEASRVLGYIGTHIPAKGIHHLLDAFGHLRGEPRLRIWGRPREPYTSSMRRIAASLPNRAGERVEWMGEYQNERIVPDVFDRVDAIVVPSIWTENSPLVIHEAQQARVPVVTADVGGMAEYVRHEVNGLLFRHRDRRSMAEQMQRMVDDPALAKRLGRRGYLLSPGGDVPSVRDHVLGVEAVYRRVMNARPSVELEPKPGPWRITFDTNPDDCNLRCVMCEEHSPHSTLQLARRAAGRPRRRMDIGLVRQVLESCKGTRLREVIPSTMGEPLLYEHFDEFIDLCREFGVRMNLTTNGTFPKRGARNWAERLVPICSDVKISINGATAATQESVMIGTRLEQILANVREFICVRDAHAASGGNYCRVTFQTTFLASNVAELPDLVKIAASLGVDRVKGHHLWVHFSQIEGLSMRRSRESIERWNEIVALTYEAAATHLLPNKERVLLENIHPLDPDARDDIAPGGPCPFLGEEAWVSAEGRFNPCCAPDALRRTLGEFGNVIDKPLMEIWRGPEYGHLQEYYRDHRLCQTCNMRKPTESR